MDRKSDLKEIQIQSATVRPRRFDQTSFLQLASIWPRAGLAQFDRVVSCRNAGCEVGGGEPGLRRGPGVPMLLLLPGVFRSEERRQNRCLFLSHVDDESDQLLASITFTFTNRFIRFGELWPSPMDLIEVVLLIGPRRRRSEKKYGVGFLRLVFLFRIAL